MDAPARPVTGRRPLPGADVPMWAVTTGALPDVAERVAKAAGVSAPAADWATLPGMRRRWRTGDEHAAKAASKALRAAGHAAVMRKDPTSRAVQARPETFRVPLGVRAAADSALESPGPLSAVFTVGPGVNRTGAVVAALSALATAAGAGISLTTPASRARVPITVSVPQDVLAAAAQALLSLAGEVRVSFTAPPGSSRSAAVTAALRAIPEATARLSAVE